MSEGFHADFAAMLLGGAAATTIRAPVSDASLLAIYRNNVARAAIEALRAAYPAVNRLTGDQFFSPMAKAYWQDHPPRTRTLTLYGAGFADHVRRYEPASSLPYLADIARLDRVWLEALHAVDVEPCQARTIAAMPPQDVPVLAPGLHPSVRILHLDWPVYDVWEAHRADREGGEYRLTPQPEAVIVHRPRLQVRSARLTRAIAVFLDQLDAGHSIEQSSITASLQDPNFDVAAAFGDALAAGYLAGGPT
ncbi:putative DNA-binding domain-containing protein [Maricaulis sp.]|uniref:HvfC/BufC family peptide modification chaperone n=1 Tax=Maricaulis sp. TaxID=1486257 RepID=UPI003A8CBF20